jgi:hypothetical protein
VNNSTVDSGRSLFWSSSDSFPSLLFEMGSHISKSYKHSGIPATNHYHTPLFAAEDAEASDCRSESQFGQEPDEEDAREPATIKK